MKLFEYHVGPQGLTQDLKNRILRPNKKKFLKSEQARPQEVMDQGGRRVLHDYQPPRSFNYQKYFKYYSDLGPWDEIDPCSGRFKNWVEVINYGVPPHPPSCLLVNLDGSPMMSVKMLYQTRKIPRKNNPPSHPRVKKTKVIKTFQRRLNYSEQLVQAFSLLDYSFCLLEDHKALHSASTPLHGPYPLIPCRDAKSYYSCNFNRYPQIWMILLNALSAQSLLDVEIVTSLDHDPVASNFKNKNMCNPVTLSEAEEKLNKYKSQIYQLVHSGYNLYDHFIDIPSDRPVIIDKIPVHTVLKKGMRSNHLERSSYCPIFPPQFNSDYLADYSFVFSDTIKKWLGQNSIVHHHRHPEQIPDKSHGVALCKTTIEPQKPRICFNARPLAGAMCKIPCRLDDIQTLIPMLQIGKRALVSDDKQGKF